jgi:outer membrane protein assembly factor BamD (BamD/ComL family)
MAVAAYEAFLASYPAAADAAQVHLLVGLITARYLGDPRRAIDHLQLALDGLSRPDQRDLAQRELAALRAAYPNGQEST